MSKMNTMLSWFHAMGDNMPIASSAENEENLQISVPHSTKKSLKIRSAETGDPMRVIVLKALAAAGIEVPEEELKDRRKVK